jgi:hypothetical protein
MLEFIFSILAVIGVFFRNRSDTAPEVLALRQQLTVLKRKRPRPPVRCLDRLFWIMLRHYWSRWVEVLVIVKPSTVVGWQAAIGVWYKPRQCRKNKIRRYAASFMSPYS